MSSIGSQLMKSANEIAEIISNTPTEARGILLKQVAEKLEIKSQYHTASCFNLMAEFYGVERENNNGV